MRVHTCKLPCGKKPILVCSANGILAVNFEKLRTTKAEPNIIALL